MSIDLEKMRELAEGKRRPGPKPGSKGSYAAWKAQRKFVDHLSDAFAVMISTELDAHDRRGKRFSVREKDLGNGRYEVTMKVTLANKAKAAVRLEVNDEHFDVEVKTSLYPKQTFHTQAQSAHEMDLLATAKDVGKKVAKMLADASAG